jgi:adenosylcobinamide-GDP ribazoletransferase
VVLSLTARVALLASIGTTGGAGAVARGLIAAHVLSRWSSLPLIHRYDYVRDENSRSRPFASAVTTARLAGGTALAACLVVATVGAAALPLFAVSAVVTALGGRYFRRRIGGITGDCLGAANQLVELSCYLTLAALGAALLQPGAYRAVLGVLP